ncbi:pilin [Grimontia hollisae]|uniref:Serogroup A1 n=1 Tax=Grimontia hollisae TaxID=673 RepID=A0A377HKY3_GRIHO|nr:pilin [Grimontia hollisae]STO56405.1 Serogroup A1 [Grimontia hollisae]STQ77543.1 Serogroup A1 [Grimontia hollisae]
MKKQQGFSLIELLIVVAIIGALTAIAIPAYESYTKKSDATAGVATLKSLLTNIDLYTQNNEFPANSDANWTSIGGAKDMTALGTLALAQISSEGDNPEVTGGTITLTFNENTSLDTKRVQYQKSTSGWKCVHDTGVKDLKSCTLGSPL